MPRVSIDHLQPGVFISLSELGWLEHPFLLNSFRIADKEQIGILRRLGLKQVEWDPAKSTAQPIPESEPAAPVEEELDFSGAALETMLDSKRERAVKVREQRERLARCERLYEQETSGMSDILNELGARPVESHARAKAVVGRIVGGLIKADSVAVHLVNMKGKEPGLAHHAMNVMVLSLLLGKAAAASEEELKHLGLGALFHDIGKTDVPSRILRNPQRNSAEENFYQAHVGYGIKQVAVIPDMAVPAKNVIACHHERFDGNGFPNHLAGARIPRLARMVAIANRYDNLCNPFDLRTAKMPTEAVAQMFKHEAGAFDPELLKLFIKVLGIYPPGSFVQLSDGSVGIVVETNTEQLLRPLVMLYDKDVPRHEALLLDLSDAGLTVTQALHPAKLPVPVVEYLAPRGRVDYYVDAGQ
jgi:HD-GYP domain-containing protein (c-di-GMP phosphodiesterase class II)